MESMKFRKKPIVIEAIQYDGTLDSLMMVDKFTGHTLIMQHKKPSINTLEGKMIIETGDWIIKGINGEFYPCKPDIFEKTYEKL